MPDHFNDRRPKNGMQIVKENLTTAYPILVERGIIYEYIRGKY